METVTTREPEWDDIDRAMIDAYLNWRADLHSCGRPLSESLMDPDVPDPDYQVAVEVCRACRAFDKYQAEQAKTDQALLEQGRHPDTYRIHTVQPLAELPPDVQKTIRDSRPPKATPTS